MMKMMCAAVLGLSLPAVVQEKVQVDPAIPAYSKVEGVSGNLSSVGSDTLNNLMTYWAEGFQRQYPNVRVQIEGKGSTTAPPALIEGTSQLGPMSRAMKSTETDKFEAKYGYKPTELRVALDALAIYVHKDCPLNEITLEQADAVFSKTRKRRHAEDITTWGQLGVKGEWATRPISLYGRNSASGTYGFFKENALKNGDFKSTVKEQPGSASVVLGITEDRYAMGYSGIGYTTSGVKKLKVAEKAGAEFVPPTADRVNDGSYPLWRYLFVYINKAPNRPLDPLLREFATFVFSKEGQEVVVKDGFFPIPSNVTREETGKIR